MPRTNRLARGIDMRTRIILLLAVSLTLVKAQPRAEAAAPGDSCDTPPLDSTGLDLQRAVDCKVSLRLAGKPLDLLLAARWSQLAQASGLPDSTPSSRVIDATRDKAVEVGLNALQTVEAHALRQCVGEIRQELCPWYSALGEVISIVSAVAAITSSGSAPGQPGADPGVDNANAQLWTEFVVESKRRLRRYSAVLEPQLGDPPSGQGHLADFVGQAKQIDQAMGWLPARVSDSTLMAASASLLFGLVAAQTAFNPRGGQSAPTGIPNHASATSLAQLAEARVRSSAPVFQSRGFPLASASALLTAAVIVLNLVQYDSIDLPTLRNLQSARDGLILARERARHDASLFALVEKTTSDLDVREAEFRLRIDDDRALPLQELLLRLTRNPQFGSDGWLTAAPQLLAKYYSRHRCRDEAGFDLGEMVVPLLQALDDAAQARTVATDARSVDDVNRAGGMLAYLLDALSTIAQMCVHDEGVRAAILSRIGSGLILDGRPQLARRPAPTGLAATIGEALEEPRQTARELERKDIQTQRENLRRQRKARRRSDSGPAAVSVELPDPLATRLELLGSDLSELSRACGEPQADVATLVARAARPAVASALARCGIRSEDLKPSCSAGEAGDMTWLYRDIVNAYSALLLGVGMPDAQIELCGFARSVGIDCADERGQSMFASPSWRLLIDPASPFWKSLTERGWHPELEAAPDSPSLVRVRVEAVNYLLRQAVSNPPLAAAVAEITLPRGAYAVRLVTADGQTALASSGIVLRIDGSVDPIDSQFALPKGDLSQIALDLLPEMPGAPRFSPRPYWVTSDRDALR